MARSVTTAIIGVSGEGGFGERMVGATGLTVGIILSTEALSIYLIVTL